MKRFKSVLVLIVVLTVSVEVAVDSLRHIIHLVNCPLAVVHHRIDVLYPVFFREILVHRDAEKPGNERQDAVSRRHVYLPVDFGVLSVALRPPFL